MGKLDGMVKVLFIFGTRPEAIKLCPVVLNMRSRASEFETRVCVTGQHRGRSDPVAIDALAVAYDTMHPAAKNIEILVARLEAIGERVQIRPNP